MLRKIGTDSINWRRRLLTDLPLSAIVITRNEEANIESCLDTLGFAGEVLVVDSGSTDRTVELARRHTNRVFEREWKGRCDQLNHAATLARNDWILVVDADERVTADLAAEISLLLPGEPADAFRIRIRECMFGGWLNHGGWEKPNYIRLYRRDRGVWEGRVHTERVTVQGAVGTLNGAMLHYSHLTVGHFLRKMDLYTAQEAGHRYREGRRPHLSLVLPRFLYTFVGRYFYRSGWRDGARGFVIAFLMSVYYALEEIRLWEEVRNRSKRNVDAGDPHHVV